jgi:hypothetical protein
MPLSWDGLAGPLRRADSAALTTLLLDATEQERLEFAGEVERRVRSGAGGWSAGSYSPAGLFALLVVACVSTAARAATLLNRRDMRGWNGISTAHFLRIARIRQLPWIGDLGVRLARGLSPRDVWGGDWRFVEALLIEGGAGPPVTEGVVRGWVQAVQEHSWSVPLADALRGSPWLDLLLPSVFEIDGLGTGGRREGGTGGRREGGTGGRRTGCPARPGTRRSHDADPRRQGDPGATARVAATSPTDIGGGAAPTTPTGAGRATRAVGTVGADAVATAIDTVGAGLVVTAIDTVRGNPLVTAIDTVRGDPVATATSVAGAVGDGSDAAGDRWRRGAGGGGDRAHPGPGRCALGTDPGRPGRAAGRGLRGVADTRARPASGCLRRPVGAVPVPRRGDRGPARPRAWPCHAGAASGRGLAEPHRRQWRNGPVPGQHAVRNSQPAPRPASPGASMPVCSSTGSPGMRRWAWIPGRSTSSRR